MRIPIRRLLSAFALAGSLAAAPAVAADAQPIFNGKDLTGWTAVHDARFEVHDGNLRLIRGLGWLRTEREYGDFILELELRPRVERYDSGLLFRAGLDGKPWPTEGWQVNLRRDLWGALIRGNSKVAPSSVEGPDVDEAGPWSRFRLEVRGNKATLDVDGQRVWETDRIDRTRGYIGIQAEDRSFDFRNLRVQDLDAAAR